MLKVLSRNSPRQDHFLRSVLNRVQLRLLDEYRHNLATLSRLADSPFEIDRFHPALVHLARARAQVTALLDQTEPLVAEVVLVELQALAAGIIETLRALPTEHVNARKALAQLFYLLIAAQADLRPAVPTTDCHQIIIPAELLYQCYHELFPPERMLVGAARRVNGATTMTAVFEVTGASSLGHVRADPARLGSALMAMERSGTYLAVWLHSHPGRGAEATYPSTIDIEQHHDWIQVYSSALVSAIVVAGGWLRVWGMAVEGGTVDVKIVGEGITKEESDDHLYRLVI